MELQKHEWYSELFCTDSVFYGNKSIEPLDLICQIIIHELESIFAFECGTGTSGFTKRIFPKLQFITRK